MLILFFVLFFGLFIWRLKVNNYDLDYDGLGVLAFAFLFIDFIVIVILTGILIGMTHTIPKKIAIYEEENARIESQLNIISEQYMQDEQNMFLVQSQIDTYVKNSDKIKELKSKEVDKSVLKFLLYFGD